MKQSRFAYFFSQPHQPFFALGIINAVVVMLLFLLAYRGILAVDPLRLHGYGMIFPVFSNVFYGFTLTTFPRFSAQPPIDARRYLRIWLLNLLAALSFYLAILLPEAFYAATIFTVFSFAYLLRIFALIYAAAPEPRNDQYWIIVAFGMGALANLLWLLAAIPCQSCRPGVFASWAVEVGVWLYLILMPVVIGFRMVPFFSRVTAYAKSPAFHSVTFALLLGHVLLEAFWPKGLFAVDLLLALWLGRELWRMGLPVPNPDPLLWSLHLALFWLPLGLFVGAMAEFFDAWFGVASFRLPLHLLALGFVTTILVAFGTRVVLGHGGAALRVDRWGVALFWGTQAVVLGRALLSIMASEGRVFPWFDISAALWILLWVLWLLRYGKILFFGNQS